MLTRILAPLGALALALACSSEPPTAAELAPLLREADSARLEGDWAKAGPAYEALADAVGEGGDPILLLHARRGSIQAQAASDGPGALQRAQELITELGGPAEVGVDLLGGLAADFKTAGARAEALTLVLAALEPFPTDPGLRNLAERLQDLAPEGE